MDNGEPVDGHGAEGQVAQKLDVLRRELGARPFGSDAGEGIELGRVTQAAARLIMISPDDNFRDCSYSRDDWIGVRPVAHQVAQTDDLVVFPLGHLQASFQPFQFGVNVAEQQMTPEVLQSGIIF